MTTYEFTEEEKDALYNFVVEFEKKIKEDFKGCRMGFSFDLVTPRICGVKGESSHVHMGGRFDTDISYTIGCVTYTLTPKCQTHANYKRLDRSEPRISYAIYYNRNRILAELNNLLEQYNSMAKSLNSLIKSQKPVEELTMSEIEDKLGHKVKIVGEPSCV